MKTGNVTTTLAEALAEGPVDVKALRETMKVPATMMALACRRLRLQGKARKVDGKGNVWESGYDPDLSVYEIERGALLAIKDDDFVIEKAKVEALKLKSDELEIPMTFANEAELSEALFELGAKHRELGLKSFNRVTCLVDCKTPIHGDTLKVDFLVGGSFTSEHTRIAIRKAVVLPKKAHTAQGKAKAPAPKPAKKGTQGTPTKVTAAKVKAGATPKIKIGAKKGGE